MKRKIELIGHRYNKLVVIGYAPDYVSPCRVAQAFSRAYLRASERTAK